jgi:hypothetical protein
MKFKHQYRIWEKISAIFIIAVFLVAILGNVPKVAAGSITQIWAMETNMATSGSGPLYLAFKVATAVSTPSLTVALAGTGASVATSNANLAPVTSVSSVSCTTIFSNIAGITVYPGTLNASGSGATITLTTTGNFAATTAYCVVFSGSGAVTNPSSAGINTITVSDTTDSGTGYYVTLSSPANTYNVTAAVAQTFTMTVGSGPDALGTLSAASIVNSPSAMTASVGSNAANGVALYAYDANTGLKSTTKGNTIASLSPNATTLQTLNFNPGTAAFITTVNANGSSSGPALTIATPFNGTAGTSTTTGDGLSTVPAVIGYTSAPTNGAAIKIWDSAAINATTPEATDYTDTVTIVGTGSF